MNDLDLTALRLSVGSLGRAVAVSEGLGDARILTAHTYRNEAALEAAAQARPLLLEARKLLSRLEETPP